MNQGSVRSISSKRFEVEDENKQHSHGIELRCQKVDSRHARVAIDGIIGFFLIHGFSPSIAVVSGAVFNFLQLHEIMSSQGSATELIEKLQYQVHHQPVQLMPINKDESLQVSRQLILQQQLSQMIQ
jgi:hypothetical protein